MTTGLRRYRLTTTLQSPTTIGDGMLRGNVRSTRQWIPGETMLGALAAATMREHGPAVPQDHRFAALFRRGRFGPAYIDGTTRMPLSVVTCKYKAYRDCEAAPRDLAWVESSTGALIECLSCGGKTEFGKGEIVGPRELREPSVHTHVRLTGRETATDGDLFQRSTIRATTTFTSIAFLPEEAIDLLPTEPGGSTVRIRLGGARSSQGAARVEFMADSDEPPVTLTDEGRLVVRLLSPGVLVDRWGRPAQEPDAWAWELDEAFPALGARVERQWIRWEEHGGWQSGGFPKPRERVATAGSVLTVAFDSQPTVDQLASFRRDGIGLRTSQGFGWIELDQWRDVIRETPSSQAVAASSSLRALAVSDPGLARRVLSLLRSSEEQGDSANLESALWRREWFRTLPAASQRKLTTLLTDVANMTEARAELDDALRTSEV